MEMGTLVQEWLTDELGIVVGRRVLTNSNGQQLAEIKWLTGRYTGITEYVLTLSLEELCK